MTPLNPKPAKTPKEEKKENYTAKVTNLIYFTLITKYNIKKPKIIIKASC